MEKKSTLGRLMQFTTNCRGKINASVLLAVIGVAAGMVPYFAAAEIVIALFEGGRDTGFYVLWCGVALAGLISKVVLMNVSTALSHAAAFQTLKEIRLAIASKLTRVPMGYLLETPSGKLKNTTVDKVESLEITLAHILPEMTSNILVPIFIIAYMFTLDWRMALASLATLPLGLLCFMLMMRGYTKRWNEYTAARNHMESTVVEYVNGIEVIKAFSQSANSYQKFTDAVKGNARAALDWMKDMQVYFSLGQAIWPSVLVAVLPIGCWLMINGALPAWTFITIMILSLGIVGPMVAAVSFTDPLAQVGTVLGEIFEVLDEPELARPQDEKELKGTEIVLKDVTFAYKDKQVLKGVDLAVEPGTVTALVGPSGSGKSTIAKLIAGFWDVQGGSVTLGGVNIKDIPSHQLMNNIAYVSQDSYLFDDTVRENIRMGRTAATDEEVEKAAKACGCHDFIMDLEKGYDTRVGSSGGQLSGGERQRVAIARAMLKNAPIVVFDEATAYTDPENEALVQSAVAKLVQGRTLIVIAHRLSTIVDSDKIVVVNDGSIAATGTHDELLEKCGLYRSMWKSHIGARDSSEPVAAPRRSASKEGGCLGPKDASKGRPYPGEA
ncbi:ABC transporter ATP-binding protein [Methanomassiliicoccus luminyensis]|uniref:ABC transporter ATP-binding protein n=1 Tax=Methanomassiliicoccus luminyensis TaxID=1080712 RepID=UPI0003758492|nr:ABC transporter ATP-binding protein [Methanomassiliicoccus luminyensis]